MNLKVLNPLYSWCKAALILILTLSITRILVLAILANPWTSFPTILTLVKGFDFDFGLILGILALIYMSLFLGKFSKILVSVILFSWFFIHFFIFGLNVNLFKSWGSFINLKLLIYIQNTPNLYKVLLDPELFSVLLMIILLSFMLTWYIQKVLINARPSRFRPLFFLGIIVLSFLWIRGFFREIPRNLSDAYIEAPIYSATVLNPIWHLGYIYATYKDYLQEDMYNYFSDSEVDFNLQNLFLEYPCEAKQLFNFGTVRPNIVLIMMEGLSAATIKGYDEKNNFMPYITSLLPQSYWFSKAYSVGFRTEQGMTALYSGLFAAPYKNITDNLFMLDKIPTIFKSFEINGYDNHFLFGGDIEFAQMGYYLKKNKVTIESVNDFPSSSQTQNLGVPDSILFLRLADKFKGLDTPFFLSVLTQSTHEPYDIDVNRGETNEEARYLNAVKSLDRNIQHFMKQISQDPKFNQTIFIFTADHAHQFPDAIEIRSPKRYHIPLILYSPSMNSAYMGQKDSLIMRQNNFPATLSALLGFSKRNYSKYAQNHFSQAPKFSFSVFVNGYVYFDDKDSVDADYTWTRVPKEDTLLLRKHKIPLSLMQRIISEIKK
jgi:phosphoglycerol transferase MdoB-like AlkP superfamily enzyme